MLSPTLDSSARDGDRKLLADEQLEHMKLFNLAQDPYEVVDLAAQRADVVVRMLSALRKIADSVRTDPLRPSWVQTNREAN